MRMRKEADEIETLLTEIQDIRSKTCLPYRSASSDEVKSSYTLRHGRWIGQIKMYASVAVKQVPRNQ